MAGIPQQLPPGALRNDCVNLLAQSIQTSHEFARVLLMSEWWHWLALLAVCFGVLAYVVVLYIRDSVELSSGVSTSR